MPDESFLVTALPYSADPNSPFHVSLFVSHRLSGAPLLRDYPTVADWAANVQDATFTLTGSDGNVIAARPLRSKIEPALWPKVFPGDLAVESFPKPQLADVPWRTFAAHRMDDHARVVHGMLGALSPTDTPDLTDLLLPLLVYAGRDMIARDPEASHSTTRHVSPLTRLITNAIEGGKLDRQGLKKAFENILLSTIPEGSDDDRRTSPLRALELLDAKWTEQLDAVTEGGTVIPDLGGNDVLGQLIVDVHGARRYYERPEEQRPYQDTPDNPPAPHQRPEHIEPDFHKRCALLCDTPGLLRELGLVVDLEVDDVSDLLGLSWITADIAVDGIDNQVPAQPKVTCSVHGTSFSTVSASGAYQRGALKLGDDERFRVLDLDPDASALKLERFLRTVPRLAYAALNGDPVNAAPPSLRAAGFAFARSGRASDLRERLADVGGRDAELLAGTAPPLSTEDVTRGIRLEVWDDISNDWHSVHERLVDVDVDGDQVVTGEDDVGFLQGAALTRADESVSSDPNRPYHAHEVFAGWEGWSLAAPPPGLVVVDDRTDPVPPPDEKRVTPVAVHSKAKPGTLPRLQYGRSYSFRAWSVDLAGNSPPKAIGDVAELEAAVDEAMLRRAEHRTIAADLAAELHRGLQPALPELARERALAPGVRSVTDLLRPTGREVIDGPLRARLARTAATIDRAPTMRTERIRRAFHTAIAEQPIELETTAGAVARDLLRNAVAAGVQPVIDVDLVTTPKPFLRWDPVPAPAWVPGQQYTDGESLHTVVIRSGVDQDADGEIIVVPPDALALAMSTHPELGWRSTSQRFLVPPKSSQQECERHGLFDDAMGKSSTAADRRKALATSLRESGTFFDRRIAHPTKPGEHVALPANSVVLLAQPGADPGELISLDDIDDQRGRPPATGQYVIHDVDVVDAMKVPYLADPLAEGVCLRFPDAGGFHHVTGNLAVEGVTLPYEGDWPDRVPFRLVLSDGDRLDASVDAHVLTMAVPPGERLRMRVSSSLRPGSLDLLGPWRGLAEGFKLLLGPEAAEAAVDGWLWWLTPYEDVTLVHAVPRPVEAPRVPILATERDDGSTDAPLLGLIDVHGPSTERIDIEASWTEPVDDPAKPGPETTSRVGIAGDAPVGYEDDLVLMDEPNDDGEVMVLPDGRRVIGRSITHAFEDTKHRVVEYVVRATTRYREYFPPALYPTVDDISVVSAPYELSLPSTARPAKPRVRDVVPLFRWDERTEPDQAFGTRRARRAGLRIYLERPWYSTGDGELLAVVLDGGGEEPLPATKASAWAADPVWLQEGPTDASDLPLVDTMDLFAHDGIEEPGRPVAPPIELPLVDLPGQPMAKVLAYKPEYNAERKLWFVDVAFDPGTAFWPFVRLVVARYQPESNHHMHLSPTVLCDFAQLTPERVATVTRPDAESVRVLVTGAVGTRSDFREVSEDGKAKPFPNRRMLARVERRDPAVVGDLGWVNVETEELPVVGQQGAMVTWGGTVALGTAVPARRPGPDAPAEPEWRVVVEEWEFLPTDGPNLDATQERAGRVVYADHVTL